MNFIKGDKHDAQVAVDEIVFRRGYTVVICMDGIKYEVGTVDYLGKPLTMDVQIEMYPSATSIDHKAYCN